MSAVEERELLTDVPGGKVYVKIWRSCTKNNQPPVILLHDSLGCTDLWRYFPFLLCEKSGRTVISYDRLGFGRSSKREKIPSLNFVAEEAEVYIPALLDSLEIDKFMLLGHSVGGAMGLTCAGKKNETCLCVIAESSQTFVETRTRLGILQAKSEFEDPDIFKRLEKYHGDKTQWVLDAWIKTWLSDEFSEWSLEDALPKVKCPTLVIHGDQDEYGSLRFPEMISECVTGPSIKKIIPDCGHVPHREKPELILDLVIDFMKNL